MSLYFWRSMTMGPSPLSDRTVMNLRSFWRVVSVWFWSALRLAGVLFTVLNVFNILEMWFAKSIRSVSALPQWTGGGSLEDLM